VAADDRLSRSVLAALVSLAATIAIAQSWLRWLNPIIDTGRDLYISEQLRLGATLYRDILYVYPPLTPYLLAAITSVIGSSLVAYMAIGATTALLTAFVLATIARRVAGMYGASAVLLVFVSFCIAGVSGWGSNYVLPYSYAAIFGMLLLLSGAALLSRQPVLECGSRSCRLCLFARRFVAYKCGSCGCRTPGRYRALALALLLACSWMKVEYAMFASAVVLFAALTRRISWKAFAAYVACALASLAFASLCFGFAVLRASIFPPALISGGPARTFYAHVTGMDRWQANLLLAVRGALLIVVFALLLRMKRNALTWIALVVATVLLANDTFFRAWSLLQLALIPFAIRKPREPLALLLLLSLCGTSRVFLNLTPAWYGFTFIAPVLLLIAYVLFAWLPERGVYRREAAVLWMPLIVAICASGLVAAHATYADGNPVATPRGTYYDVSSSRAYEIAGLLAHLRRVDARELVVMPEGLTLNYLAKVPTPLRYQTFTPAEVAGAEGPIVAELAAKRPQYVAIVPRDVSEFGSAGFGVDYGREIVAFLRANYDVEQRFGGIVLLRVRTRS
jgi:hypothetical protein